MPEPSEQDLLQRSQSGDHVALGRLLEMHQKRLYNVCLRMVGNRDDAAEATQETLLRVVRHIRDFRGECQITSWMTRIAMNQAVSVLRKRKTRRGISLDGEAADGEGLALRQKLVDSREPAPDRGVQLGELRDQLAAALAELDAEFRAALVLRDVAQMDYQQIAEVLEVPLGTAKSRIFRARLAMRQHLSETSAQPSANSAASAGPSPPEPPPQQPPEQSRT
ncbi:MAG: RNA polymerase sigma factor [Phycisphaeraceae bacterium]